MRKFQGPWVAGTFRQISGRGVSSLTGLNVSSAATFAGLTINSLTGAAGWRGIATISSGTTIASVAATAAVSGAVILLTAYQGVNMVSSGQNISLGVESVSAGAFQIRACGSIAPTNSLPVVWLVVR